MAVMYYYVDPTGAQCGPVEESELKNCGVNDKTLVWCAGMSNWQPAGEVIEEFKSAEDTIITPPEATEENINIDEHAAEPSSHKYILNPNLKGEAGNPGNGGFNPRTPPDNYMLWSILVTILCSLICGVIAIYFSSQVKNNWIVGNEYGALQNQKNAKIMCFVGLGLGILRLIGVIIYIALLFSAISSIPDYGY